MKKTYKCETCGKTFKNCKIKANHIRWTHRKYDKESYIAKVRNTIEKNMVAKKGCLKSFKVSCTKCKKELEVQEREKEFPKRKKYFCSRGCANSRTWSDADKMKKSFSIKHSEKAKAANRKNRLKLIKSGKYIKQTKLCKNCDSKFVTRHDNIFCSRKCLKEYRRISILAYRKYVLDCRFNFPLQNYPDEFDFSLFDKYGTYKAKNRGDNLNGISRDHIVSMKYGFENNISSEIIRHPANCQLLTQSQNSLKHIKCGMTIEELLNKIKSWDEKYKTL